MTDEYEPFDLEAALKDPDRVRYRDGSKTQKWVYNPTATPATRIVSWTQEGLLKWHYDQGVLLPLGENNKDLVLEPEYIEIPEFCLNVYPPDQSLTAIFHFSKRAADKKAAPNRIACIHHPARRVRKGEGL